MALGLVNCDCQLCLTYYAVLSIQIPEKLLATKQSTMPSFPKPDCGLLEGRYNIEAEIAAGWEQEIRDIKESVLWRPPL